MVNLTQILSIGVLLAIIGGSAYLMNMLFGLIGIIMLVLFLVPVLAIIGYFGDFSGSSEATVTHQSKGAREGRE